MELQEEPNNLIFPEQGNGSTTTRVRMYVKWSRFLTWTEKEESH